MKYRKKKNSLRCSPEETTPSAACAAHSSASLCGFKPNCILYLFFVCFLESWLKCLKESQTVPPRLVVQPVFYQDTRVTPFCSSCAFLVRNTPTNHVCMQDMKNCRTELQMHKASFSASRYVNVSQYSFFFYTKLAHHYFPTKVVVRIHF